MPYVRKETFTLIWSLKYLWLKPIHFSGLEPRGVLLNKEVRGLGPHIKFEAKFGARSGQVHQIRGKTWEVLAPQDAKVGKSPNFGVISKIQRAKFGVFVIYTFGGKIWGSNKNFRGNFGAKPHPPPTS